MRQFLKDKGDTKMDHKKIASKLFIDGYNCAQAVFAAFSDVTGLEDQRTNVRLTPRETTLLA